MARLALLRDELQRPVRSAITLRGYANDWVLFNRWCAESGCSAMPASSDTVTLYLTWLMLDNGRKAGTGARHVSAIKHYHRLAGQRAPISDDVKDVLAAVKRQRRELPQGKAALTPEDLARVSEALPWVTNAGARDRAMLILGFATALRRSDLARLELADISFADQGLIVVVRQGKTDQIGRGRILSIWAGENHATDPVRVLQKWIECRGLWPGPLFTRVELYDRVKEKGLSGEAVHEAIKRAIDRAGMDSRPYGAHSLRAGAITAVAINGGSDQELLRLSGHKNAAIMRGYVRVARVFSGRNPLAGIL